MSHVFIIKIVGISFALAFLVYQLYLLFEFSGVKTPLKHKILSVFVLLEFFFLQSYLRQNSDFYTQEE